MRRVLITGGTGFVGANLARHLLTLGDHVHLLLRPKFQDWRIKDFIREVELHVADIADRDSVAKIMQEIKPDRVFHLAVHGAYSHQADPHAIIFTNLLGTSNLIEASLRIGVESVIHTGSSSEYGFQDHPPSEKQFIVPNSPYAVTKAAATHWCSYHARSSRVPMPTARLYSVYGPWEEPNRFIPTMIAHSLRQTLPALVDPEVERDFIYVEDVCDALIRLADKAPSLNDFGAVYNVGTGVGTKIREAVAHIQDRIGETAEPAWGSMKNRAWDATTWVADNSSFVEDIGWQAATKFPDGLEAMANWYVSRPDIREFYESAIF